MCDKGDIKANVSIYFNPQVKRCNYIYNKWSSFSPSLFFFSHLSLPLFYSPPAPSFYISPSFSLSLRPYLSLSLSLSISLSLSPSLSLSISLSLLLSLPLSLYLSSITFIFLTPIYSFNVISTPIMIEGGKYDLAFLKTC